MNATTQGDYEIRFESLYQAGKALAFPCDAKGHVEMDALTDKARNNYLYARAVVGREFASPSVVSAGCTQASLRNLERAAA